MKDFMGNVGEIVVCELVWNPEIWQGSVVICVWTGDKSSHSKKMASALRTCTGMTCAGFAGSAIQLLPKHWRAIL